MRGRDSSYAQKAKLAAWWLSLGFLAFPASVGAELAPASPAGEPQFLHNVRQLTFEGKRSGEGYFSPDGKALVFQSEREPGNPFYQIYLLDLESGESHRLSPGLGKTTCAFFRAGNKEILFASTHLDPQAQAKQKSELEFRASGQERRYSWDYDDRMDIFVAARDASQLQRLTDAPGYDAEGSYSPDGTKIVFTSLRDAYPADKLSRDDRKRLETDPAYFGEIYVMNADGSEAKRLTASPGYDGGPFFSPDGQRIVWRRFETNGAVADVWTMKMDGTDARRVTDFGCMSWAPFYHPSGRYIIFTANKLGFSNFELYVVDIDGQREPVRITFTDGFDGLPTFTPDGKRLAWTSNRSSDGASQVFLADWNDEAVLAALSAAPVRVKPGAVPSSTNAAAPAPAADHVSAPAVDPEIRASDLQRYSSYLASNDLEGRMTGSRGAELAAQFIAAQLERSGIEPLGDGGTFFQEFSFNAGVNLVTNGNQLTILGPGESTRASTFPLGEAFRPLSFTASDEVEGEVVFAGYGLSVPGKGAEAYDSYAGLDVTNKIVVVLRYVPEKVEPKRRQELNRYAGLRYKAMVARERGATAILVVTGPNSPNAGELVPLSFDSTVAGSGIVAASIAGRVAEALFEAVGKQLGVVQSELDTENPHAEGGFVLPKVRVRLATKVDHVRRNDRNVIGILRPGPSQAAAEYVLVGAHYDHLGKGESGAMLRPGEAGQVHAGADDNASGVSAVLELAAALAEERRQNPGVYGRGLVFGLWSGEELGLIGSSHFAERGPVSVSNIVAYLNFDMIGRMRDNRLVLQGVGSSPGWRRLIEKRNVAAGLNLTLQEDPYLPTDVTAFYPKQVPVLNFFTGSHDDYHRPTDTADRLNLEGMERIAKLAHGLLRDLTASGPRLEYAKLQGPRGGPAGQRENLRAYLGTIPDYATDVTGVKLSGVRSGSPAEKAGLTAGDVIVEFGGQQIKNIYDYTYALDAVKIGQATSVTILRGAERQTISVTPEARK